MEKKLRIDTLLVERAFFETREKAKKGSYERYNICEQSDC